MNGFEYYSGLQYRVKAQAGIIREFEPGERYLKLKEKQEAVLRERDRKIRRLEKELAEARQEILHVRKLWFESEDDLEASYEKIVAEKDRMIKQLREEKLEMARQRDAALDKCREKQQEIYRLGTRLEEAEGQNKKLTAQINKDFENSSLPSSLQGPRKKKVPNSRVRTGRKPGGQPGHKGYCRKKHPVTETHEIPAPDKYRNSLEGGDRPDPEKVTEFEGRYDKILDKAEEEYEYEPPGEYYKEGYNLYRRLKKYKESELRFLHDMRVPANNSLCERLARVYKRKQKQAITLRSQKSLEYICDGLSIVYLLRSKEKSVYKEICNIYNRKRPIKSQKELTGTDA